MASRISRAALCAVLALSATAVPPATAQEIAVSDTQTPDGWDASDWDLGDSGFQPEEGWRFGKLANGMRYIIRPNDRPEQTAIIRLHIAAGSLDERDDERGFAHFVEHMAFNGSTNVPEGEMVKLLEREGLAFGADTNASTGFDETIYKLDLPRAEPELLDTALMMMRETVGELTFDAEAVARERGVILSERRVRNTYSLKNVIDSFEFLYPHGRVSERLPIGTLESLEGATAEGLRAFWEREYLPEDTVLVLSGDFPAAAAEQAIREHFADWQRVGVAGEIEAGTVDPALAGQTDIYLDPALSETVTLARHAPYIDRPDTLAERQRSLLTSIGSRIIARRIQRLSRSEDPPFRGVSIGASDYFEDGRTMQLSVATEDGGWQRGLEAAIAEYRTALEYGFSEAELAEQVANIRTALENAAANSQTRTNAQFVGQAAKIIKGNGVPTGPAESLARFEEFAPQITPDAVLTALKDEYIDLGDPLIRFTGKTAPAGGEAALREVAEAAFAARVEPPSEIETSEFAYTDFGEAGEVVSDTRTEPYGIRTVRFANGVMLNIKPTELEADRVRVTMNLDGGALLKTPDEPLNVELVGLLSAGGLGEHSRDELQTILSGRSVGAGFSADGETFVASAVTTPRDFELQLQLMAAYLTDPGYRDEGLGPWRQSLADFFARLGKTPASAYSEAVGPILSDRDPRFSRQPMEAYQALDYSDLRTVLDDRLATGAIEIGIVGDIDEAEAIDLVAQTFGALPSREAAFQERTDARQRSFTDERRTYVVPHDGEQDQALMRLVWPTDDDSDWDRSSGMTLLASVVRLKLLEKLREELGQAYSASATSAMSDTYDGYGTFSVGAQVDAGQLDAVREAIGEVLTELRSTPVDADTLQRARQPILESLANRLKTNAGWITLADRAQSEADYLQRLSAAEDRYRAMTTDDLLNLAQQYLEPAEAVEIRVVPREQAGQAQ
ncbi:insulinase family protein [Altererythrobacter sp. HHU K3-1]|uniref:Insulinase family protein n=2 Tax=Qipengyuania atrilutea TaxID=2744473 RepID=A0A850H735_9SPHN|nr:insulinase family protein [Actirhodobacter atriluteus]